MDNDVFRSFTTVPGVYAAQVDARGVLVRASQQLYRRLGCQPDDLHGRYLHDVVQRDGLRGETIIVMVAPDQQRTQRPDAIKYRKILTKMDSRILEGVAAGVPTAKLAGMVELSRGGVEYHVTNLLRKLRAPNRTSLVSKAYAEGILAAGTWPPKVVPDFVK
ncbi:LuxR C-terminal-related transcriptional regulator [Kibdelosporangium persicum]|uniref:Helix-turn-helix transcriptional regulator n=1 Tax=Kibdelosporangium persicum TaxID=2698649 RepID=A0ABX2EYQ8_9PSEU|nr:LuxR C-terminal-related transcriptional regulator [Kibdelosporangium persicum]NRN64180.1 Helix-turn-helix transcriptional regulator [Kibdelosporangium persicum]